MPQDAHLQAAVCCMRESERTSAAAAKERLELLEARPLPPQGPMRNLHLRMCEQARAALARFQDANRSIRIESIVCEYTQSASLRNTARERQRLAQQLQADVDGTGVLAPDDTTACKCGVQLCMSEAGDLLCPSCGVCAPSLDVTSESQSTESQMYHYKHRRYAYSVLETLCGGKREASLPSWVIDAVIRHLLEIHQVRRVEDVTVGMVGLALDFVSHTDAAGKQVRGRKFLKNRTDLWCRITGNAPPVLVPRLMDGIINLFGAVVQGPYVQWVEQKISTEEAVAKHNFQAYQSFLKNAIITELFRMRKESAEHVDIPPLEKIGQLDIFMDQACPSTHPPEHDAAWVWCIQSLHPELHLSLADLKWNLPKKRKRS